MPLLQAPVSRRRFMRSSAFLALGSLLSAKPPMTAPIRPRLAPNLPLDAKIGQMLLLGFRGTAADGDSVIARNVRDQYLGGVVLFGGNIRNADQLRTLTSQLQALAPLPLLISTDQEGGKMSRLDKRRGYTPTLSHEQLGADNNLDETRAVAEQIADLLVAGGITLNLAPVVDVAANPDNPVIAGLGRSFSADPAVVAAQAGAFIDGHHAKGIKCTIKHFPGHGSSQGDTHLGFVDVTDSWSEDELLPYRDLLAQRGKVDAVMTAHIFNAHLDPELPATLSPAVVKGLLRKQLGYDGVVISDDMQMRAITDLFKLEKAFELAILAGIDIVAVTNEVTDQGPVADRFFNTVHRMLDEGVIDEERIEQSFQRIMRYKGLA